MNETIKAFKEEIAALKMRAAAAESRCDGLLSVFKEATKDREHQFEVGQAALMKRVAELQTRLDFIKENYANAIHYCCRVDGDLWNTDFYGTLDRTIDQVAKRKAAIAAMEGGK